MIDALRAPCARVSTPSHAGLALQRYLAARDDKGEQRRVLLEAARAIPPSPAYHAAFTRWRDILAGDSTVQLGVFNVIDRLMIGLGDTGVLETGITLHHTYGVPYIPGSALKGLLRHASVSWEEEHAEAKRQRQVLFGDTSDTGHLVYHDALYIPGSANGDCPLHGDVMTVHHPKYYADTAHRWPGDFDDPTPVTFLSTTGSFLVAIQGASPAWRRLAFSLLQDALSSYGIGGKTSSGYGRGNLLEGWQPSMRAAAVGARTQVPVTQLAYSPGVSLLQRVQALKAKDVKGQLDGLGHQWMSLSGDIHEKGAIAQALRWHLKAAGLLDAWKSRAWVQQILAIK